MLDLPSVTLCAATSVNLDATIAAIEASAEQVSFADMILFTDAAAGDLPPGARLIRVPRLRSGADYSKFILQQLAEHVRTDHCLIVQWDGFVLDARQWDPAFLDYDYIGAQWPQFGDGRDVGNGGFSLRSRRLLEACRSPEFVSSHPEDVAICRINRNLLEQQFGVRFAEREIARRFAFERMRSESNTFGFHGVFNMIPVAGEEAFWNAYRMLDDRTSVWRDLGLVLRQFHGPKRFSRRLQLLIDRFKDLFAGQPINAQP